ncbi:MAG: alkaline phosphatase family protein [Candidatus Omnitrophota bacterium]
MTPPKMILLGLDGATFQVLDPLIATGKLPNFNRLKTEGCWSEISSNIHPITPSAWASICTGLNPGKHGVFDFRKLDRENYRLDFVNGNSRKGETLWWVLSKKKKKVGIVNVPLTYPPEPVNGFMVSGMDTPFPTTHYTYPAGFSKEIEKAIGPYQIDLDGSCSSLEDYLAQVEAMFQKRIRFFEYLVTSHHELDLLFFVFVILDRFQHVLWKYLDPSQAAHALPEAAGYRKKVEQACCQIDELIGRYYFSNANLTSLMVVSDHGFGPLMKDVYLNRWLESIGLLVFKKSDFRGGIAFLENIDWSRTQAYSYGFFGQINLNLKGREAQGIVKKGREEKRLRAYIKEKAMEFIDPATQQRVVTGFFFNEELYKGAHAVLGPDIVLILKDYAYITRDGYESFTGDLFGEPMKYHDKAVPHSGNHRREGVFVFHRKDVLLKNTKLENTCLNDIFPTVLDFFDVKLPHHLDGRSLIPEIQGAPRVSFLKKVFSRLVRC